MILDSGQVSAVYVCSDGKGGYLTPNNAARLLKAECARLDLPVISPHELRHAFITILEDDLEAPQPVVCALTGKSYKGQTADYLHHRMTSKEKWMSKYWDRCTKGNGLTTKKVSSESEILNLA